MERIKQPPLSLGGTGGAAESQHRIGENMRTWKLTENTSHTDLKHTVFSALLGAP